MTTPEQIEADALIRAEELRDRSSRSFLFFARSLVVPTGAHGPRLFDEVMADFQREAFELVAPTLHAIKDGEMPERRRWWIERTKKASKDTDIAVWLLWLMAFAKRPLLCQVCASNSEQAAIVEDRARELVDSNRWLGELVEIVERKIRSARRKRLVRTRIEATGTAGAAQGPTPDLLILNELVHVDRWETMEAHMNNADGVPRGVAVVSTNAGIRSSKAEIWRDSALANPDRWTVLIRDRPAPWISDEDIEDARRRDPVGAEFARLWRGRWISGRGNAVDEATIERLFCLEGPRGRESGLEYVAGLDLGIKHDHAGVAVCGVDEPNLRVRVSLVRGFAPEKPNSEGKPEVDSDAVEREVLRIWREYRVGWFGYDPAAGGSFMAQRLRRKGVPMREVSFSKPAVQTAMAESYVTLAESGRLELYEDPEGRLRRDLGKFDVSVRPPSRYKLEAVSDEHGHADVGFALAICLPRAVEMLGGFDRLRPDQDVAGGDRDYEDLTEEELDQMPAELREICEAYDDLGDDRLGGKSPWDDFEY